jgi:rSAM/selenodomain-associated transferase 2
MNMDFPRLSIIVPMLNEVAELPAALTALRTQLDPDCEVVLVDGGSSDASVAIARSAGFEPIGARRGRARQMNAGAERARGEVLVFLHVDTRLPEGAVAMIEHALATDGRQWGRFDVRIAGPSRMLRVVALLMNLRSRLTGIATGDQAIFVTRAGFAAVGGFPDQPLMEDIELSRRLLELSRPACIHAAVVTSGRRWEQRGLWRTILLMWRLRWAYWRGVPAAELAKRYE